MYKFEHKELGPEEISPFASFVYFILLVIAGGFVGGFLGMGLLVALIDAGVEQLQDIATNITNYPEYRMPYLMMQGIASMGTFLLGPWVFLKFIAKKNLSDLKREGAKLYPFGAILVFMIAIVSAPFLSYLYEVNREMYFGEWAQQFSKDAGVISNYLTNFDSTGQFLVGVVIMAIIPAFCEEFAFRGILQNLIFRNTRNISTAVWLSAVLFSFIHLQFDGFFVRLLLAASFGYIYYWTGSLWYPILGHFINNLLALVSIYLAKQGMIEGDPETFGSMGLLPALVSLFITIGLHLVILRNRAKFNSTPQP